MVILHIKLKVMKHTILRQQIFALTLTLDPWGLVQRSIFFFSESSHVAYQINRNKAHSQPLDRVKRSKKIF